MAYEKFVLLSLVMVLANATGPGFFQYRDYIDRQKKATYECGQKEADIVFVLDESGSIFPTDFDLQIEFVKNIVDMFDIGPEATHIGAMTFASQTFPKFALTEYDNGADIKAAFGEIWQEGGGTKTYNALEVLRTEMFREARDGVKHIAIVITDGESNDPDRTAKEAQKTKDEGITIFSIGVGQSINEEELGAIASEPAENFAFMVEDYSALDSILEALGKKTCEVTTTLAPTTTLPQMVEGCTGRVPIDVIFSIPDQAGVKDTDLAIDFIQEVIGNMKLSPVWVQAGLAPRDCAHTTEAIRLRDNDNHEGFNRDLDSRRLGGATTETTLEFMHAVGFQPEFGAHEGSAKFGILILDNNSRDLAVTQEEAELARERGVNLIVIGVGDNVEEEELQAIASRSEYIHQVAEYGELASLREDILRDICNGAMNADRL